MILQHSIEQLKDSISIQAVISKYVQLKKNGTNWLGCCPFHNEKTPSFNVNEDKQFYKCFGCGVSGDVFEFIQKTERLSFYEAVVDLADQYNFELDYDKQYSPEEKAAIASKAKQIEQALQLCQDYYINALNAPEAKAYIKQRGLDEASLKQWKIGWAPNNWNNVNALLTAAGLKEVSLELGLIKEKDGSLYDKYRSRLIIPSYDHRGRLNGFIGRYVGTDDKQAKYLNPSESSVYHKSSELFGLHLAKNAIEEEGFAYLVEGNLDVVSLHQFKVENTVCPGGTSLTLDQVKMLNRYTDKVCIMTDGDTAGETAAIKWIDLLIENGFVVKIIPLEQGEDPDSFARKLIASNDSHSTDND